MPEGPTLIMLKEEVQALKLEGKKIIDLVGYAEIDKEKFINKKVVEFKTWGKHFLICFNDSTIMVHLMLFGSYLINESKKTNVKLGLKFTNAEINFYVVNVKVYDKAAEEIYDWSVDIMSGVWNSAKAFKNVKDHPKDLLCDILVDQQIFAGSGNIIKNEALYRAGLHPLNKVGDVPDEKLKEIITRLRRFSFEFLKAKKADTLDKHFLIYEKKVCPECNGKLKKEYTGKNKRRTYFCENCQKLYS